MVNLKNKIIYYAQSALIKYKLYKPKEVWYSYSSRDYNIVDYKTYEIGNLPYTFRGPKPEIKNNNYVSFAGAAQTFGVYCQKPFPDLVKERLNYKMINLGMGGAGPSHFLHDELLSIINKSSVAVIQLLSARSVENSIMENCTGEITIRKTGEKLSSQDAYSKILLQPEYDAEQIILETRQNYVNLYKVLLSRITVPKILFWFSERKPAYQDDFCSVKGIFNSFPQMVNQEMVDKIANDCDECVFCISKRGLPQKLISRFTNKPVTIIDGPGRKPKAHNYYYPSPEMHDDAAKALIPIIKKYL
ncbi:MAG: DUF6473 family protein [Candidatus Paceibacterota bacterium]